MIRPILKAALAGTCLAAAAASADTSTFQQGVADYASCRSVLITDQGGIGPPGTWNDNGHVFGDGSEDWVVGSLYGSLGFSTFVLLRFDDLGIPANATVTSASLTLNLLTHDSFGLLSGRYLARSWDATGSYPAGGTTDGPVGWRYYDKPAAWSALAALGEGGDLRTGSPFSIPSSGFITPGTEQQITIPLDTAMVQDWVSDPAQNHGLRIQNASSGTIVYFVPPQRSGAATRHPKLTIEWAIMVSADEPARPSRVGMDAVPNPFRIGVDLRFTLPEDSDVRLIVVDLQGRTVARLADRRFGAGAHTVPLDASHLAAGVYHAVLERGTERITRRLVRIH
jgi:hypothetical protein